MIILFISENYYPQTSGVPVVVKYLAEGLTLKGHKVAVATKSCGNPIKKEDVNGVIVYRFDIYKNLFKQPAGKKKDFINFVLNYNADVIIIECTQCITTDLLLPYLSEIHSRKYFHVHGISGLNVSRRLFSLKSDIKHTIGNTYNYLLGLYYFKKVLKKALPYFNATMCLSEIDDGIDYLKEYSPMNYILDNAADNMFFDYNYFEGEGLSKYVSLENSSYLLSCANYSYIKNQEAIIKQYYESENSKSVSLVCIGSQPNEYYKTCCRLVEKLEKEIGHRDVHLLFGIDRKDIPAVINKASLYLVGSIWEQYSISIIEAMSQGVPFISTNVGNSRLLPGGITLSSIDEMHEAIDTLLNSKDLIRSYSEFGREFAFNHCRINVAVDKLERIIQK